jgi:hypothetical protein
MESLYNILVEQTGKDGIYYNADIDEPIKKGLRNVNIPWKDKSFIITNSVITCGVNYDDIEFSFDTEFIMVSSFSVARDIIQVSYRPRKLNTNIINITYVGSMHPITSWETDDTYINCPIYTQMIESILIEKKSPIRQSIELFCNKAHYAQQTDTNILSSSLEIEIQKMLQDHKASSKKIPDIDFSYEGPLRDKIFKGTATMLDKLMLQKYFFKKRFINKDDSMIDDLWDLKLVTFVEQHRKHIKLGEKSIFRKIQIINGLESIFDLSSPKSIQIRKLNLTTELRDQIFTEFKFKNLHKASSAISIIFKIYNTFFGTPIIHKEHRTKNNVEYWYDDMFESYDEYLMGNCIGYPTEVEIEQFDIDSVEEES